jgi:osmotically-inducible protein OsmY
MKSSHLFALLLSTALVAGCAGMGGQGGSESSSTQRTTGETVDDATITARVKSALLADPEISGLKINVDTSQGKVRLKGEVKSMALRKKTEALVKEVNGVKSVDNQLVITG